VVRIKGEVHTGNEVGRGGGEGEIYFVPKESGEKKEICGLPGQGLVQGRRREGGEIKFLLKEGGGDGHFIASDTSQTGEKK